MKYRILLIAILLSSTLVPGYLGLRVIPLGSGPDELSHIDHVFFLASNPLRGPKIDQGLYQPGLAPLGQGHQPPLYYALGAGLLSPFLLTGELPTFTDYQAGIGFSYNGFLFGGNEYCSFGKQPNREDPTTKHFRHLLHGLRLSSVLLFVLTAWMAYLAAKILLPKAPFVAISASALTAAVPTAIWRSTYFTNDNLVTLMCSLNFLLGLYFLQKVKGNYLRWGFVLGLLSGLCFLSKYNGILGLGLSLVAVLLKKDLSIYQRIKLFLIVFLSALAIVLPDVLYNIRVDGDITSTQVVSRVVPFLHNPSSFWHVLQTNFLMTASYRFWLTFHNIYALDQNFPLLAVWIWVYFAGCSLLGLLLQFKFREFELRPILYTLSALAGALIILVYFGTKFPLAGGRYLHTAIVPVCLLVSLGFYSVLLFFLKSRSIAASACFVLMLVPFAFGHAVTFSYQNLKFNNCKNATEALIPAGVSPGTFDLDGDGSDEVALFHRIRNRLFLLSQKENSFRVLPEWTRLSGLVTDSVLGADLSGDNVSEVILWRPASKTWFIGNGNSFLGHDKTVSPNLDSSVNWQPIPFQTTSKAEPLAGDVDGDGRAELVIGEPENGIFRILWLKESTEVAPSKTLNVSVSGTGTKAFLKREGRDNFLATYDNSSGSLHLRLVDGFSTSVPLPKHKNIIAIDYQGDGNEELVLWSPGEACLVLAQLRAKIGTPQLRQACAPEKTLFSEHVVMLRLRRKESKAEQLATFDRKTGHLDLLDLHCPNDKTLKCKIDRKTVYRFGQ